MALNFAAARTQIMNLLGKDDSSTSAYVTECLDVAQRDVARSHKWSELFVRAFFNTSAEYHTGTVTTNGTTTITLAVGTWPTAAATDSMFFALSAGGQWYQVATRSSDSVILLAQAYIGASASGLSYSLYKNRYSLGTAGAVDRVLEMTLHDGTRAVPLLEQPSDLWVTDFGHFPSGLGVPSRYSVIERDANGNVQVLLGPSAPDAIYRVEYVYRKAITEGSFVLSEPLVDLVIQLALALAYRRDHFKRYMAEMALYRQNLTAEIARAGDSDNTFTLGEGRVLGTSTYLNSLLDFGTVSD